MEGKVQVTTMRSAATARGTDPEYSLVTAGNTAVLSGGKVDISSSVQVRRVYWAGDALRIEGATIGEVAAHWNPSEQPKIVVDGPAVATIVIPDGHPAR
jgi:ferric-dicitrate binding protein FerR (iron transport regulator)